MLSNLNDNYYLRNCFMKTNEVPTQSLIRQKMCKCLAQVYFGSMSYKHKVLIGLEPKLEGSGKDRLVYPRDILAGRPALKPIKKEFQKKIGHAGISFLGEKLESDNGKALAFKIVSILEENDKKWKKIVKIAELEQRNESISIQTMKTNSKLYEAFEQFELLYMTSLTELEDLLQSSSVKKILFLHQNLNEFMQQKSKILHEQQRDIVHKQFNKKLNEKKNKMKCKFVECIKNERKIALDTIEHIHSEKNNAQKVMRQQMECQSLARKMYVVSVERYYSKKRSKEITNLHESDINKLRERNKMHSVKLTVLRDKIKVAKEFNVIWQKKATNIVNYFKEFVFYCLKNIPEQKIFFENIDKMFCEHLSEANSDHDKDYHFCGNMDEEEEVKIFDRNTEINNESNPFVLYGDFKPKVVDENLCKRSSHKGFFPVIIVNKKCIYGACDNLDFFSEKLKEFVEQRGDTDSFVFEEESAYQGNLKLLHRKEHEEKQLESSLMKVIQSEISNISNILKESPAQSCVYDAVKDNSPSLSQASTRNLSMNVDISVLEKPVKKIFLSEKLSIEPCACAFSVKNKLKDHLPPYMYSQKKYCAEVLPQYEACTQSVLKMLTTKKLVQKPIFPTLIKKLFNDVGSQCNDAEYESICKCSSNLTPEKQTFDVIGYSKLFENETVKNSCILFGSSISNQLDDESKIFAMKRAESLKNLLVSHPSVANLF